MALDRLRVNGGSFFSSGTSLRYKPGLVTGGSGLTHDCGKSRSIGYFLEPLVCLALFGKKVWICCMPFKALSTFLYAYDRMCLSKLCQKSATDDPTFGAALDHLIAWDHQ